MSSTEGICISGGVRARVSSRGLLGRMSRALLCRMSRGLSSNPVLLGAGVFIALSPDRGALLNL